MSYHHLDSRADLIVPSLAEGDPNDLLPPEYVAQLLHIALLTLTTWRSKKVGPPYKRLSQRLVRYPRGELITWLNSRNEITDKQPPPSPQAYRGRDRYNKRARETKVRPPRPGLKKPAVKQTGDAR